MAKKESRQETLDRTAALMPEALIQSGILAPFSNPELFFKTLGWHQWKTKHELTEAEQERFRKHFVEAANSRTS